MAAAAPAPPAPINPRQQWIEFNLELWRPNRNATRTEPGQTSVSRGALNAWNRLSAAARNNVTTELTSRTRHLTHGAMAVLPATVGNPPTAAATLNFFTIVNRDLRPTRLLLRAMDNLHSILPDGPPRTRVLNYCNQVQANVTLRTRTLGLVEGLMARSAGLRAVTGGILPAGANLTYDEIETYLMDNLGRLQARVRGREALERDLNTVIAKRAGATDIAPVRRRIYFDDVRTQNGATLALERAISEVIEEWSRDGLDVEEILATIGGEPSVDELREFIHHLDKFKALEAAMTNRVNFHNARDPGRHVNIPVEVQVLYQQVNRQAATHTAWLARATQEVNRLHTIFTNSKWRNPAGLTNQEQEEFEAVAEEALLGRESLNADLSGSWIGPIFIGAGGHGRASLWVKQDSTGHIVDRVIVKDTPNENSNQLNETDVWHPPEDWPMEVAAMYKLVDLPGSHSIVNIRNWRSKLKLPWGDDNRLNYRIYMEYCPGGDLKTLWSDYYPRALANPHMPEPFIWFVADSLITAGQMMGGEHLRREAQPLWDQIVHGDMKPDNVFLGENTSGTFRGYSVQAKLADFGTATIFPAKGIVPPYRWVRINGLGYRAPELARIWPPEAVGAYMPGSKANVWGFGMILRLLLQHQAMHGVWQTSAQGEPWQPPDFSAREHILYSPDLRNMIMDCLQPLPQHRPAFWELRSRVLDRTDRPIDNATVNGLRNAPPDDQRFVDHGPPRSVEKYALGLAVQDLEHDEIPQRVPSPPAVTSPVAVVLGGIAGTRATAAEPGNNARPMLWHSVISRKRTFEAMQAG